MRIGFDIDGVLADFNTSFIRSWRSFGWDLPDLSHDYPSEWNYDRAFGIPKKASDAIWTILKVSPGFWLNLPPIPGAIATLMCLKTLEDRGDMVVFITNRPGEFSKNIAQQWLTEHGFSGPSVYVTSSADEKATLAKELGLDFFIDDKMENCLAVSDVVPYTVVLDRPWNRQWDNDKEAIMRVFDPIEAVEWARGGMDR